MRRSDGLHILYENIPQVEKQAVGRRIETLMKNTDIRPSDIAQLMHISVQAVADVVAIRNSMIIILKVQQSAADVSICAVRYLSGACRSYLV